MAKSRKDRRLRRKMHIRKKLSGTEQKPRVFVFKSLKYVNVGIADDDAGKVLYSKRVPKNIENSKKLGVVVGKQLKDMKVESVVFDRSGYKYHGQLAAIADAIRESGIKM